MNTKEPVTVEKRCYECGSTMRGLRENYRYTECGLDSVTLANVLVFHCQCGAIVPEIPAVDGLHRAIVIGLLKKPSKLCADEIRFLRKFAGYSATKLAAAMGVTKSCVSRWESGKKIIGPESDRLLRFVCFWADVVRIVPNAEEEAAAFLEIARTVKELNLTQVLEVVEKRVDERMGSHKITIDPATLSRFGSGGQVCNTSTVN